MQYRPYLTVTRTSALRQRRPQPSSKLGYLEVRVRRGGDASMTEEPELRFDD